MNMPFPGMDPYLEHPVLWESFHARLIPAIANQLQPQLDPRYVTTVEERVFIEGPQRRIPDVWVEKRLHEPAGTIATESETDTAVILEVEELEIRQKRVEILDLYNGQKLVAVLEVISPTNKEPGPGRDSYARKQEELLASDCHLVEIDLLRNGTRILSIPDWRLEELAPFDYLVCVNRWPHRKRYENYPRTLRQRLPRIRVPLAAPDPDVRLDVQAAVEQAYADARYCWRIRYDEPCIPPLSLEHQARATQQWQQFRAARIDLFPRPANGAVETK
jgi:hypothetical protein